MRGVRQWWTKSMACVVVTTAALSGALVAPASAALVGGTSVAEHHPLPADQNVPPTTDKFEVMTVPIVLQAGQSRRVSDQLTLSLTDDNHPEVDNDLACFYSSGDQVGDESNGGTNYQGSTLAMRASMILHADRTDTYECKIMATNRDSHVAIARAGNVVDPGNLRGHRQLHGGCPRGVGGAVLPVGRLAAPTLADLPVLRGRPVRADEQPDPVRRRTHIHLGGGSGRDIGRRGRPDRGDLVLLRDPLVPA